MQVSQLLAATDSDTHLPLISLISYGQRDAFGSPGVSSLSLRSANEDSGFPERQTHFVAQEDFPIKYALCTVSLSIEFCVPR